MFENGFSAYVRKKFLPVEEKCRSDAGRRQREKIKAITLVDIVAAFFLLGIGLALSFIALASELIFVAVK